MDGCPVQALGMKQEYKGLICLCSTSNAGLTQYILTRKYLGFSGWEG